MRDTVCLTYLVEVCLTYCQHSPAQPLSGSKQSNRNKRSYPVFKILPIVPRTKHPINCSILPGGSNIETRLWKTFVVWVKILGKSDPSSRLHEHAVYAANRITEFMLGNDSATEHTLSQLEVEELAEIMQSAMQVVLDFASNCKPDVKHLCDLAHKFAGRALQRGIDSSNN